MRKDVTLSGRTFVTASMSSATRILTILLLTLPLVGVVLTHDVVPSGVLACVCLLTYTLLRPRTLTTDRGALVIHWMLRTQSIEKASILRVMRCDRSSVRRDFGPVVRIGVGGLWGTFGFLFSRRGKAEVYVSNWDHPVLIERRSDAPLIVSPQSADEFVRALGDASGANRSLEMP